MCSDIVNVDAVNGRMPLATVDDCKHQRPLKTAAGEKLNTFKQSSLKQAHFLFDKIKNIHSVE